MSRFFAFGCSYTDYYWPSWADLLGIEFDHAENWGKGGLGNRAIAERVAECHTRNTFTKDDVVIVQWSTHLRHDWYNVHNFPDERPPGWKTFGGMFSIYNKKVFTPDWIKMFFYEPAYVMHTLNSIKLVQELLKSTGCQWYMTSIGDIRNLGSDIDVHEDYSETITSKFNMAERYPEFKFYETSIWHNHLDRWVKPLHLYTEEHANDYWWFKDQSRRPWKDTHPSITHYAGWIKDELSAKISISPATLIEIDKITNSVETLKKSSSQLFDFVEQLNTSNTYYKPERLEWPHAVHGF